jgi:nucleotide-binding universal stress UspA family protein
MQKIIVASDLSERSRPAIKRAVEMAVAANAKLILLNIVNAALPEEISHPFQVGATTILTNQVSEDLGDRVLDFDVNVMVGDPVEEINTLAITSNADLLIVGLHRRRTFLDQIRETTMEHLVRSSRIPILLVTEPADQAYQSVLCGIAFSDVCSNALKTIPLVAPDAEVSLFHAHEMSFGLEAEREFETWKAVHHMPRELPDPIYVDGSARDALENVFEEQTYDLLVVGGHTRADGGRYFIGRFTAGLIRNPPCDILIGK